MKIKQMRVALLMTLMVVLLTVSAHAKNYTKEGTYTWVESNGLYYAYDSSTNELITNRKVGNSYVDENGTRYLNQFVDGVYYDPEGIAQKKFKGGWLKYEDKMYYFSREKMATGYCKISKKYYYFAETGERLTGIYNVNGKYRYFSESGAQVRKQCWKKIDGKKYRLFKYGVIKEGFFKVGKKKYYQTILDGVLTGEQEINGKKYYFKESGVYSSKLTKQLRASADEKTALGEESDALFFTQFESGSVGYSQTGGDSGKACGKYQFDYRYSLIPFLKYCYNANSEFFDCFKPFLSYSSGDTKLINNSKLYKAWAKCYEADADYFSSMQDKYAMEAYYKPVQVYLAARGYNLTTRPYVIRGAVFSYAIQHGSIIAAKAVMAAKLTDSVSDEDFLEELYDHRWKDAKGWNQYSLFRARYVQEKAMALSILNKISS